MSNPKKFGIWANTDKNSFWNVLPEIISWSKDKELDCYLTTKIIEHKHYKKCGSKQINSIEDMGSVDFMLVLGGDGTFLSLARTIKGVDTPILGIHLGDLGFLAKVTLKDLFIRLEQVSMGNYFIEDRILAEAVIKKNNHRQCHVVLNDFVICNGESHRMLNSVVYVDGHMVGNYRSDGLVISTPTGSTAYSLSAGGPIVTPKVETLIITPTAAHTLTSRPLVIPASSNVTIKFPDMHDLIQFIADGQIHEVLDNSNEINITRSKNTVKLIDFNDTDYFETLRMKMGWGKRGDQ